MPPTENLLNSNFLTSSFFATNITNSLGKDLKVKKEFNMHPNQIHLNRYINFIYSRKFREIPEGTYVEKHHIIPRSLGGNDEESNLIILTGREHFIAHMILWKVFGGKMATAFWFMSFNNRKHCFNNLTSRQYEELKKEAFTYRRCWNKGIKLEEYYDKETYDTVYKKYVEARTGIYHSEETKKEMSKNRQGEKNPFYGRKHTEDTKKRQSEVKKGKNHPNYGKHRTQETKNKMSISAKKRNRKGKSYEEQYGREKSIEYKEKLSAAYIGSKFINKNGVCKRIKKDELDYYLKNGWVKGQPSKNKKKCPYCDKEYDPGNYAKHIKKHF